MLTAPNPAGLPERHKVTNQGGGDRREAGHQTVPDQWLGRSALLEREAR